MSSCVAAGPFLTPMKSGVLTVSYMRPSALRETPRAVSGYYRKKLCVLLRMFALHREGGKFRDLARCQLLK